MKNNTFNDLPWHDSILKSIHIDRGNPGIHDVITMVIEWNPGHKNSLIFKDVYFANMKLNFGVLAEESILDAGIIDDADEEFLAIKEKWKEFCSDICGYAIHTASTGSEIRIFAMSFHIH
jgi:hypothetical protein